MAARTVITAMLVLASSPVLATGLDVSLVPGTTLGVPHDYTGDGDGFPMGAFEIHNPHTAGLILHSITTTAIGSGDDSIAFSEIGLFLDSNDNGLYDPGIDTRYGQVYTAYPVDDGSLTFTESLGFAPGETRRFIIVGKLGAVPPPVYQRGFRTIISSISATGGPPTGVPTPFNEGISVFNGPTSLRLEYDVTGSGPPYDYTFRIVLDNHDGSWSPGQEWSRPSFGMSAYGAPSGTAPFATWATNPASYPIGPYTSTGWGTATIVGVAYHRPVLVDNPYNPWMPSAIGDELIWWGTADVFMDEGEMAWSFNRVGGSTLPGAAVLEPAYRVGDYIRVVPVAADAVVASPFETGGGDGFLIGAFDLISHSSAATLSEITIAASGTGDDSTAFSEIGLFVDSNANGLYDPGLDQRFGQVYAAYPADDGTLTFNDTLNFNPDETKRVFVVAQLNGSTLATYGQTFDTTVTAISATGFMHSGLPSAAIPGVRIHAPTLTVSASATPQSVAADEQGPGGMGLQAAAFTVTNNNVGVANLDSITVAAAGAMFDHTAFSFVALYEDANDSGDYDAADTLYGTPAGAFPNDDGSLTFSGPVTFAPDQSRVFFLVVKLNGQGEVGADFWTQAALGVSGGTRATAPSNLVASLLINAPATKPPKGKKDSGGCAVGALRVSWLIILAAAYALIRPRRVTTAPRA